MRRFRESFVAAYLSFDPRSLAAFRIALGTVLMFTLYWRYLDIDLFYTNAGILPNHTLLWAPPSQRMFSLFFTASTHNQALFGMVLCAIIFLLLIVGYRTRLMQVLSLIAVLSLNGRLIPLENGGDIVLNLLSIWSLFLPLGRRFSIDAVVASMAGRREHNATELADRSALRASVQPAVSLAALALILQFFLIYFFNALSKDGPTWMQGTAVHYTLHQDRLITPIGVWLRENLTVDVLRSLTFATLAIEYLGAFLIIVPVFRKYARAAAIVLMPGLHLGFAACLDLGPFSYAMACFFPLLMMAEHWNGIAGFMRRRYRKRELFFDADCGVCFFCARLIARLDLFDRVTITPSSETRALPAGVRPELLDTTILVVDEGGKVRTRAGAMAAVLRSLPLGGLPSLVLLVPGVHQLAGYCYDRFAANRTRISQYFGLGACGVPSEHPALTPEPSPNPWRAQRARVLRVAAELTVALLMVANVGEVLRANRGVPGWLKYPQPELFQAIVEYPRMIQGWRMFAPHAPMEDFWVSVEAETIDNRLVDPYNEAASRYKTPPFDHIPPRIGQDQFFTAYSLFIPRPGFRPYRSSLEQWILRYHERTGDPLDKIVRFKVYKLSDKSPPMGETEPTRFRKVAFMSYPKNEPNKKLTSKPSSK